MCNFLLSVIVIENHNFNIKKNSTSKTNSYYNFDKWQLKKKIKKTYSYPESNTTSNSFPKSNHSCSKSSSVFKNASAISILKDLLRICSEVCELLYIYPFYLYWFLGVRWAGIDVYQLFLCKLEEGSFNFRAHAMIVCAGFFVFVFFIFFILFFFYIICVSMLKFYNYSVCGVVQNRICYNFSIHNKLNYFKLSVNYPKSKKYISYTYYT